MGTNGSRNVILITGAGGALGMELSVCCAVAGWEPVLVDKHAAALEPVRRRIVDATGVEPIIQPLDLATLTPGQAEDIVSGLRTGPGQLDALVHCAAAFTGLQPIDQVDPADWLRDFHVNVHAAWLLSVRCLDLLRASPAATLIFLVDNLERVANAYWGAYGVAKWALEALSKQLSAELRRTTVRVLAVDPGPMRSSLRARAYHSEDPGSVQDPATPARKIRELLERDDSTGSGHVELARLP